MPSKREVQFLVMPFRLANAAIVFMDLVNKVFKSLLNKYVTVFIDDIIVYSKSLTDRAIHLTHLRDSMIEQAIC